MKSEKKETLVLYPSPGMGHLVSMIELGKLFLTHNFAVALITVNFTYTTGAASNTAAFITRMSSAYPLISFHRLPSVSLPPNPSPHKEAHAFDLLRLSNPHLLSLLSSLSRSAPIRALIVDFFCTYAMDVATELGIPSYVFFTSGAASLAAFLHLPTLILKITTSFKDLGDFSLKFPGLPPISAGDMPLPLLDQDDEAYKGFLFHFERMADADGIIVNTFVSLEPRPLQAIADGLATPAKTAPPLYCVGPLITSQPNSVHECLHWLDKQPQQSVVFLCFGSLGAFSSTQLWEIAFGLERSEQRFLWVIRSPPAPVAATGCGEGQQELLEVLLPEGFLYRTLERGMVVKSWVPQAEILRHAAIGGFVTHCGWNSVLEAIVGGVAMVGWPLYAEQRMNKVMLVEMGLAVEMRGVERGVVKSREVEERVRGLVNEEWGRELRERLDGVRLEAEKALAEGGSSSLAVNELVSKWKAGTKIESLGTTGVTDPGSSSSQ